MIDGNISMEEDTELRDLVVQTLENNGVLAKVRAELRASVFLALEEQESVMNPEPLLNKTVKQYLSSSEGKLLFSLVREFLEYFGLDCTISVFDPETYIGKEYNYMGRNKLSEKLGIHSTEPLLGELLKNNINCAFNNSKNETASNNTFNKSSQTSQGNNINNATFDVSIPNVIEKDSSLSNDNDNTSDKNETNSGSQCQKMPFNVTITDKKSTDQNLINNVMLIINDNVKHSDNVNDDDHNNENIDETYEVDDDDGDNDDDDVHNNNDDNDNNTSNCATQNKSTLRDTKNLENLISESDNEIFIKNTNSEENKNNNMNFFPTLESNQNATINCPNYNDDEKIVTGNSDNIDDNLLLLHNKSEQLIKFDDSAIVEPEINLNEEKSKSKMIKTNIKLQNTNNNAQNINCNKTGNTENNIHRKTVYFDDIIIDGIHKKIDENDDIVRVKKSSNESEAELHGVTLPSPPIAPPSKTNSIFSSDYLPPLNGNKKTNINDLKELMDIDSAGDADIYEEDFMSSASGSTNEPSPLKHKPEKNVDTSWTVPLLQQQVGLNKEEDKKRHSVKSDDEISEAIDDIEEVLSTNVSCRSSDSVVTLKKYS